MCSVRLLGTGRTWCNAAVRARWDVPETDSWDVALRYILPEDVALAEDLHSLALKLGGVHTGLVRIRFAGQGAIAVRVAVFASRCRDCEPGADCGLVVSWFELP